MQQNANYFISYTLFFPVGKICCGPSADNAIHEDLNTMERIKTWKSITDATT